MEKIFEQALLYDFYGELLKDNQKDVFENYVLDNLSLSEIAEERGISRQGVHDMIKRIHKTLSEYEEKLHLVEKFMNIKDTVKKIESISSQEEVKRLANKIIEEL